MIKNILVALLMTLGTLKAAPTGDFKLAVVDFQSALNSVDEGKKIKAQLKTDYDNKQKDINKQKTDLEKLQGEIAELQKKASSGLMNQETVAKGRAKEEEFRKKFEAYSKLVQDAQKEITEKEGKATRDILNRLRDLVVEISREEGYSMVLEKNESGLLYAAASTDLTEKLIQKYNKKK